jgi:hypothetical protein
MKNPIFTKRRRYWKGQIRVGDLVRVRSHVDTKYAKVGLVMDTWTNHKSLIQSVDVLWGDGSQPIKCHDPSVLVLVE